MSQPITHHHLLSAIRPWKGHLDADMFADFLGVKTRKAFYKGYENICKKSEVFDFDNLDSKGKTTLMSDNDEEHVFQSHYPEFDEEYFEWIDLFESVNRAQQEFTMFELGAGYGRWMVRAFILATTAKGIKCNFVGVEAEPTHFRWMLQHFLDNGIDPSTHRLINSAVSTTDEKVWFRVGMPYSLYGQSMMSPPITQLIWHYIKRSLKPKLSMTERLELKQVPAVSLEELLEPFSVVDLIDIDVQGAELEVVKAAMHKLNDKAVRIHIGTHSKEIETGLRDLFRGNKWDCLNDYQCSSKVGTPFGMISFQDGVQTWVNKRLL